MTNPARWLVLTAIVSGFAAAAPRDFPTTWTTHLLEPGQNQLELWLTPRVVRTDDYFALDARAVWAHGVFSNLDTQLSLDVDWQTTVRAQQMTPAVSSLWRWTTFRPVGPFAAGAIGRLTARFTGLELEGRLLADLTFEHLLVALNVSASRVIAFDGAPQLDTRLEESLGLSYRLSPTASFGLELRGRSAWSGRDYQGTALYLGPTLTFAGPTLWASLGAVAQVAAQLAPQDEGTSEVHTLRDDERFQLRLVIGGLAP